MTVQLLRYYLTVKYKPRRKVSVTGLFLHTFTEGQDSVEEKDLKVQVHTML